MVDDTKRHCLKKLKLKLILPLILSLLCNTVKHSQLGWRQVSSWQPRNLFQALYRRYGWTLAGHQSISFPSHKFALCQGYTHTLPHSLTQQGFREQRGMSDTFISPQLPSRIS